MASRMAAPKVANWVGQRAARMASRMAGLWGHLTAEWSVATMAAKLGLQLADLKVYLMAAKMVHPMAVHWAALMVADSVALTDKLLADLTVAMWDKPTAARSAASKEYRRGEQMADRSANQTAVKTVSYSVEWTADLWVQPKA